MEIGNKRKYLDKIVEGMKEKPYYIGKFAARKKNLLV